MSRRWMAAAVCAVCGVGTGLCLLFPAAGPAVFVLPAPALAVLLGQTRPGRTLALCAAFCLGLCMTAYAPAFSILPSVPAHLVFWVDLAVYAAICSLHGLVLTAGLWCGLRLPCPRALRWLSLALFWALAEWLCGAGPLAWPTLQLSLALWHYPFLIQGARWGGHLLVSALVMAVNALFAGAVRARGGMEALWPLAGAAVLLLGNGALSLTMPPAAAGGVKIAVVQPGVMEIGGQGLEAYMASLALAREAAVTRPDILLLPESALPAVSDGSDVLEAPLGEVAAAAGADLLVGGQEDGVAAVFRFEPDGRQTDICHKQRQVPFFENGVNGKPFRWTVGGSPELMDLEAGRVGVLICYESMFPSMARCAARDGAQLLVVPTNDSRFSADAAKGLHLSHGVYRALETGRTLVQPSLNGCTAVVDSAGRLTETLPTRQPGILYTEVRFTPQDTPYLRWGDTWLYAGLGVMAAVGVGWRKKLKLNGKWKVENGK